MGIVGTFDTPFYSGGSTLSASVPGLYPVSIAGHTYFVDMHPEFRFQYFRRGSINLLRDSQDVQNLPGENSLNPEDLWRRTEETWVHGAGQVYFDRSDSDPMRFRSSKGLDPWTKWQLSLLPDTANKKASANTNLNLVSVGNRLYVTDGQTLTYTTDVTVGSPTWTGVTGTPAQTAGTITSDGFNVYIQYAGANGVYTTTRTGGAATAYVTSVVSGPIAYVAGRLMVANANVLYNITASGALPVALFTHNNADFTWVGFTSTQSSIYAAGYSGDKSLVYRTTIRPDGTALDVPVVAAELPDGEIIRAIQGYLGFMVIGSDRGVRFATVDGQGNLTLGALITTPNSVQCFEPQDRWIWFGYTNYDAVSSGLGRLDLSVFTAPLVPAYASDLMATGQGIISSVATFQNIRVFGVSGLGVFSQQTTKVASGTLDSGLISYGIHDAKVPMFLDVRSVALVGSYQVLLAADGGAFTSLATYSTQGTINTSSATTQPRCWNAEFRMVLNRNSGSDTVGPTIQRATLRAFPAAATGEEFMIPLIIHEKVVVKDEEYWLDTRAEINYIASLVSDRRFVTLQDGLNNFSVFVVDYEWRPHHLISDGTYWNGICTVTMRSLAQ